MRVYPFILSTTSRLQAIRVYAETVLSEWGTDWGLEAGQFEVRNVRSLDEVAVEYSTDPDLLFYKDNDCWVSCSVDVDFYAEAAKVFLSVRENDHELSSQYRSIAFDTVTESIKSLVNGFVSEVIEMKSDEAKDHCLDETDQDYMRSVGSGAVCISVSVKGSDLHFCVPVGLLNRVLPDSQPNELVKPSGAELISINHAISDQSVRAQVLLGNSEIDVEALSSLQVGDVVRLNKPLQDPLNICFSGSSTGCKGFIGKQDGYFSIQIDSLADY